MYRAPSFYCFNFNIQKVENIRIRLSKRIIETDEIIKTNIDLIEVDIFGFFI